jgi:hypothetical protein
MAMISDDLLVFNGINGKSGDYDLPPMTGQELSGFIQGEAPPENLKDLRLRRHLAASKHLGIREDADPLRLDQAGWGVIFADDASPEAQEALGELIDLRHAQAGERFRLYVGAGGYRAGESKTEFLARFGVGPGPADPSRVPYYLLIVGSPERIPYTFQTQLDVQYAVGRICFDTAQEYANYAHSVVAAETGQIRLPRRAAFFGTNHAGDRATEMSADTLVRPLHNRFQDGLKDWEVELCLGEPAVKSQLSRLLGGDRTPALLLSASHGMSFPIESSRQVAHQGALLCQDWPGPKAWGAQGAIPPDCYFSADDVAADAWLHGLVAFFFACYGAGTPRYDDFFRQAFRQPKAIAAQSFVARLPAKLLGHPRGGALAVIGHVERAWGYSFWWNKAGAQTEVFASCLQRLFKGYPVGLALEYFNERYAELATMLSDDLHEIEFGKPADPIHLAGLWTANNDARNYVLLGDPAVRLAVPAG